MDKEELITKIVHSGSLGDSEAERSANIDVLFKGKGGVKRLKRIGIPVDEKNKLCLKGWRKSVIKDDLQSVKTEKAIEKSKPSEKYEKILALVDYIERWSKTFYSREEIIKACKTVIRKYNKRNR